MIGLIEFAQKIQEPEKRRRIGIGATGTMIAGGALAKDGATLLRGGQKATEAFDALNAKHGNKFTQKGMGRAAIGIGAGVATTGAYMQHRRNKKLRAQGYTAGNPLMAKKPMKPSRSI